MDSKFNDALSAVLKRQIEGFEALEACRQLTSGASQDTYQVKFLTVHGGQTLALRRASLGSNSADLAGQVGLNTEARLLKLAGQNHIPVPTVIYQLQASDGLGEGFLMPWLEGETLGHKINYSDRFAKVRESLATTCGQTLARIHAIELDTDLRQKLTLASPAKLVEDTWSLYKSLNTPQAMIDFTARWLLENLPPTSQQSLVHGDFRNGNLMINENGIQAVLDWELAHIGDPLRDLGWLCVNSWRFGNRELAVGGFGEVQQLVQAYQAESGTQVNLDDLKFWQVFGSFWWSVTTLHMAATWRTGETPSLERPVIGRRSSEAQMDCVNLIIESSVNPADAHHQRDSEQLPRATELLESVRRFIQDDVSEMATGHAAFLTKVAANSLSIVQRELSLGPQLEREERNRLTELLSDLSESPNKSTIASANIAELRWALVSALRESKSLNASLLRRHLAQTVRGQLEIDQPKYSALRKK